MIENAHFKYARNVTIGYGSMSFPTEEQNPERHKIIQKWRVKT